MSKHSQRSQHYIHIVTDGLKKKNHTKFILWKYISPTALYLNFCFDFIVVLRRGLQKAQRSQPSMMAL